MSRSVQAPSAAYVRLWEDDDGDWTWAFVEPDAELELRSNDSFTSKGAALAAAELAYPGVEVWRSGPEEEEDAPEKVDRKREALLLLLILAALTLLFWGLRSKNENHSS